MQNHAFSKIWIIITVIILLAGGILVWQYWWVPKEEVKAPEVQVVGEEKIDGLLMLQINLKKQQLAEPTPERLEQMKTMGMEVNNLNMQRIFIHLARELTPLRVAELQVLGIILYQDSWIPPVGEHSTGFILADMPIDELDELVDKDYVIGVNTAERVIEPQSNFPQ